MPHGFHFLIDFKDPSGAIRTTHSLTVFTFFLLLQLLYKKLMWLSFGYSTVLVWDTRPSKSAAPAHAAGQNPAGILPTFKHLDLTWKPVLRVM